MASNKKHFVVKYFECRHNYAARCNGYVLDGCGEFCPTGAPGTLESFICAACHCHRNFHRKVEVELPILSDHQSQGTPLVIVDRYSVPCETFDAEVEEGEIQVGELKRNYSTSSSSSGRMRLDSYQRERLWIFAKEIMGWKWTKNNEQVIPFCAEIGITPQFLKNWINNTRRRIGTLSK